MAATQTEGMVAVVRGAGEAGVAVTLLNGNKQYTLTPTDTSNPNPTCQQRATRIPQSYQGNPVRNPPLMQAPFYPQQQQPLYNYPYPYQYQGPVVPIGNKVNAGMVTDQRKMVKCDSAVQACDGRYTSTYRRHHCHVSPTSPDPLPTEFPAQKPNLRPGMGHFVVGGSGSGQTPQTATKTTEFRGGPMTWPDRGAVCCPRPRNHPDAFVSSLRKYPADTLSPDRSSEIVERLINYTQTKNTAGKVHCNSTSRISNLEAFNLRKSLFSTQNYGQTKNIYEEFRGRSPGRSPTRRSFVEDGFGNERRPRNDDRPYAGFNRNPDVRFKLNFRPNRKVTLPTQRNNKESNTNQDTDMSQGGPTASKNKRLGPVLLDVVKEIETETIQTIQSTASYTDLSHNLPGPSIRRTKSFEVILTDSAEKFRREILGCFQGISLIPSRDPKERLLRQGLLKKLTRKLNKLCEIYKARYKHDKVPKIEGSHEYPSPRIPVVCDKNNFGATLRTIIEPSISVTKRYDTKVYLVEVPESSRAFNSLSTEFNRTVAVWLDSIDMFAQRQEKQEILNHFLTRLKMVFADRPTSQTEFREMLKAEIIYLLDCVPLSTDTNRVMYKHRYAEILLDKLLQTASIQIGETKYDEAPVHDRELKRIVSAELGCFLQDMRVEIFDRRYLECVKEDLYEILCDALTDIVTGSTEEIHTDLVLFIQESLSVTELVADEMAHSMITSIRNVKTKGKSLPKVKSDTSLTRNSGNFLVYVSRSQDKFGSRHDSTDSRCSVFEPSRDNSNDQGNKSQYQNDVSIQIEEWLNSLQISNIPNKTQAVNELAADIVDRKRYLELNLSAKPPNDDIDYLKYQIFKWINKSVAENNQQTIANAPGLMRRIQSIPVPDLSQNQSTASSSRRNSSQQNEIACRQCCSLRRTSKQSDTGPDDETERIESMLLGWLTATPLYRNREEEQQGGQERVIKKLAQSIGKYKKTSDLSKTDAELSMINMIIQHIKGLPLDNGKHFCCMRSSIVEATARNLNECLEKGIFSPDSADNFSVSDHFLRNTIEDWIKGLPFEPFKNALEAQSFRARQEDFIQRLKNSRTACCSRKKIIADIESFLMSMPFDCGKKCDPRFLNSEIIKLLQMLEVVPLEEVEVLGGGGYDSFMSGLGPTSSKDDFGSIASGRSGVTFNTMPPHVRDMIDNWTQGLPIKADTPQEKALADKARKAMVKELVRQIDKLANDPRAVADRFYLEDMLEPIIDKLLDSLPQSPELAKVRHAKKVALMQAIGDHFATLKQKPKFKMTEELANKSINNWVDSLPIPPESKREVADKMKSTMDKILNDPNLRDNPAMLDKFLDQEIDNILDSLPQTPELRAQRAQLKQKLKKDLGKSLENAQAEQKLNEYRDAIGNALSNVIPNDNPSFEANKQKLQDIMVDLNNPFATPEEKREALYKLDKIIDDMRAASPTLMAQPREEVKQRIMDALNKVPPPDKKAIGILKKNKGSLSAPQMQSLEDSLSKILPYSSSQRQAMEELGLENLVDDYVESNYRGNNEIEKLAYKEALLDKIVKVLEDIARQGLSMDINTLKGKILDAMKTVPLPNEPSGADNRAVKKNVLRKELEEWFDNLPKSMPDTPANRAKVNKLLDDLTEKILDAEEKYGPQANSRATRKAILKDFLNNAPFIKKKQINMDDAANSLIDRIDNNMAYINPDASQASYGTLGSYGSSYSPEAPSMAEQEKERNYRSNIKADIAKALPVPLDNPNVAKAMDSLIDAFIESQIDESSPLKKKEAERRLDKLVDELYEANPSLRSQPREAVKKKIMDALKKQTLPDKEGLKKVLQHKVDSSDNYRDKLKQQIRNSLPPHKLGSAVKEAEFEMLLDDIVDNQIKMQHQGTGAAQKEAFKQKMDNSMNKLLGLLENEGVKLSPDTMNNIKAAINDVPMPDSNKLREHQKEVILKEEIADWVNKLPLKTAQTPEERLERNREIEGLVQKIMDAEKNAGPNGNPEELKKKEILKWLKDCPFVIKTGLNLEKSADELLNRIRNNKAYQSPDAPLSSGADSKVPTIVAKIPEHFRKATDDLNATIADWCDEIPLPADLSPSEREEAKLKTREAGNKLVSKINEALADPKMRDDSFLFQSIAENEIDNMLDSLPQSPELQAKKEELKRNLMKKFNDIREKAKGEHAVHDYGRKIDDVITSILPSQYDNPDIAAAKQKLADTFKELTFEPLSPSQKKKVLKKFNALVDEIYDATPGLHNQPKEQVRRRLLNALKKIPPPPKKFMANELAESKLKREVSDLFHDLKVKPQSKEDKEHANKIKSALAKVLHDIENRFPPDSEEYDKQIKDALNKWARKLPLTKDQESQLPCLIGKFVEKLKASNRKRRDDLAAHLNEEEESASDEEESVCWKCKQKMVCRRPPSVPCMRPANFYIPPQCYMPPPDCYRPPPQPCFQPPDCFSPPPDCYSPLPDCYKPPECYKPTEYKKTPESHRAREYSRPPETSRQPDCNKPRECFRQPEGGRPTVKRPRPAPTKKPDKLPNCRRTNSPMASMNPHTCYYSRPPFCPRCYALGYPCNEHRY